MNTFHFTYLIFSIVQIILGVYSLIISLAIYLPKYGFVLINALWLLNAIWLLVVGIEGLIYALFNGKKRFQILFIITSFFVGFLTFASIIMFIPCGLLLKGSSQCPINNKQGFLNSDTYNKSHKIPNDFEDEVLIGSYQFTGINFIIMSAISASKIATHLIMQWSKDDLQGVYFICSSAITIGGSILFYIIEIIYKDWSLIISASSSILNIIIGIIPLGLSINGKFFSNKYKFLFLGISLCIGIIGLVPTIVIGIMYINNSNTIIMVLVAGIILEIIIYVMLSLIICCSKDGKICCFCIKQPFYDSNYDTDDHKSCKCQMCGFSCKLPNCGNCIECLCDPFHCDINCDRYAEDQMIFDDIQQQQQQQQQQQYGKNANSTSQYIRIYPVDEMKQNEYASVRRENSTTVSSSKILQGKQYQYEKIKLIGSGVFSNVWLAKIVGQETLVAIKVMKTDKQRNNNKKLEKEYKILVEITDYLKNSNNFELTDTNNIINIVQPLDFFTSSSNDDEQDSYLVLEYCPGGDLRHLINKMINKKQKISVENAWNLIGQISYVVYQLHKNSIIHSDIKPENILFTKDFQVKLSDFGMARKLQDGEQKQKATGGTISYMAPELIPLMKAFIGIKDKEADSWNKQPMQNQASDIWSIGTIFYELLALKHPFIQEDVDDIQIPDLIHRISKDDPPDLPSNYPDKMKSMIMMMLIKDQNLRIKAVEIMKIPEIVQSIQKRGGMKLFL